MGIDLESCKDYISDARENYYNLGYVYARQNGRRREFNWMKWRGWKPLLQLTTFIHCLVAFFERNVLSFDELRNVGDKLQPEEVTLWTVIINGLIVSIYIVYFTVCVLFHTSSFFSLLYLQTNSRLRWKFYQFMLTILFTIDFILLAVQYVQLMRLPVLFRSLRPFMIAASREKIGHVGLVIVRVFVRMYKFWILLLFFLLFFSASGVQIFGSLYHCVVSCDQEVYQSHFPNSYLTCKEDYLCPNCSLSTYELDWCTVSSSSGAFDNLWNSFVTMFTAFTTENYPSISFPAYKYAKGLITFFVIYLYVCIFFFEAILLGVIIDAYWVVSKEQLKGERLAMRVCLAKAWNVLLTNGDEFIEKIASSDQRLLLLFGYIKPNNTEEENKELIQMLDSNGDGIIDTIDWTTRLLDVLRIDFYDDKNELTAPEQFVCFSQKNLNNIRRIIIAIYTLLFFVVFYKMRCSTLIAIHSVQFLLALSLVPWEFSHERPKLTVDWLNMVCYIISIIASLAWYWPHFLRKCNCGQDGTICSKRETNLFIVCGLLESMSAITVVMRIFLHQFNRVMGIVTTLFLVVFDLVMVILCIQYFYAAIGYELFGSTRVALSQAIMGPYREGNDYYAYDCGTGFATMACSYLMAFQIVSTNDIPEIMDGLSLDYQENQGYWKVIVHIYFISSYVIVNIVCMQMIIAVMIEAYRKIIVHKETDNLAHVRRVQEEPLSRQGILNVTRRLSLAGNVETFDINKLSDSGKSKSETSANAQRSSNDVQFTVGERVTLVKTYNGVIDGIFLSEGEEVEIMGETNNHILAGRMGDILGYVPKEYLLEIEQHSALAPGRSINMSNRAVQVKKQNWTLQVQGDMTVMNTDEAVKLNQIFRSRPRSPKNVVDRIQNRKPSAINGASKSRPDWVDLVSAEFDLKISETQKPEKVTVIHVSPVPVKRRSSKVRFSDIAENVVHYDEGQGIEDDYDGELTKKELRKLRQREKRRNRRSFGE